LRDSYQRSAWVLVSPLTNVRFRAAVMDTLSPLNGSIDDLSCVAQIEAASIPTLSEWGMLAAAAGLGIAGLFFAVRRRSSALNS
jgi:hypothetical protein